jgi:hypothetical protein
VDSTHPNSRQHAKNLVDTSFDNENARINDVFSYFTNCLRITANYDTLLDYYNKQAVNFDQENDEFRNSKSMMVKKAKTTQSVPETTMLASPSLGRRKLTKSNTGEIDGGSPFAEKGFASMQNHKNTIVGNVLLCSELKVDKGLSSSQPRFDTEDNVQDKEILLGR